MKKLICILTLCFLVTPVFANERIEELKTEAQELLQRKQEYIQVINNLDIRLIKIQGAIEELEREK